MRPLLAFDDLAFVMQLEPRELRRQLARLCGQHGFPPPLPGIRPQRWDPAAIEGWLEAARTPRHQQQLAIAFPANDSDPDEIMDMIERAHDGGGLTQRRGR